MVNHYTRMRTTMNRLVSESFVDVHVHAVYGIHYYYLITVFIIIIIIPYIGPMKYMYLLVTLMNNYLLIYLRCKSK